MQPYTPLNKYFWVKVRTVHGFASNILHDVLRNTLYTDFVIVSFKDKDTLTLFETGKSRRWTNIAKVALRKLDQMEAAIQLNDLLVPPGNHLEALAGDRAGQHSIRINGQYRICFVWKVEGACEVEITDYH